MASEGDEKFPAADVATELNPAKNKDFAVDTVSSDIATSLELKEQNGKEEKAKSKRDEKEAMQKVKSAIIVSAVIVAVAGAVFAITKKLREK